MAKLSYNDSGKGHVIVLLHGFCESKEVWHAFENNLPDSFRVISVDLPGYGKSEAAPHLTMESLAEAVYALLQSLSINSFIVVGHSMGGYVSLALAERHPGAIEGLCLFHSTAYADSEDRKLQRNKTIKYLEEYGVEAFIRPFVPPLFFAQNRKRCEEAINKLVEIGCKTHLDTIADSAAAMRDRPDRTHVLSEASYPVLFIVGKNDSSVKAEDSMVQAQLPAQSYVQLLGDTGHQGLFEREKETIKMLRAFAAMIYA